MNGSLYPPMLAWAARELGRHPWRTLATILTLFSLALLLGGTQLIHQALVETGAHLLAKAPAIVVRRSAPTGWEPMPVEAALEAVKKVPGALTPHTRLWGLAPVSGQTVVVVAEPAAPGDAPKERIHSPPRGAVVVGGGLGSLVTEDRLTFDLPGHTYLVVQRLPGDLAMAVHDTVLMHPDDARSLLGIPPEMASDLAIEVFHEEEIEALSRDLARAFPWPVQISSRTETAGRQAADWGRSATLATMAYAPAILALAALGFTGAVDSERGRTQAGLMRALGWTGRDFLGLNLWRWACLDLPGVGLGLAVAYLLTFTPGVRWVGPLLFGWTAASPSFHLSSTGSAWVLVQTAALVALPHLAIVMATGLRHITSDPQLLMEEG